MNIQRWKQPIGHPSVMEVNPSGKYVRYKDYIAEVATLIGHVQVLRNALELLQDNQNGCPLPKYEESWNEAMLLTAQALSTTEGVK